MTGAFDPKPLPSRDEFGRMVRDVWIRWARQQPKIKPSWLVPYDELPEADKEADRMIGETLWRRGREWDRHEQNDIDMGGRLKGRDIGVIIGLLEREILHAHRSPGYERTRTAEFRTDAVEELIDAYRGAATLPSDYMPPDGTGTPKTLGEATANRDAWYRTAQVFNRNADYWCERAVRAENRLMTPASGGNVGMLLSAIRVMVEEGASPIDPIAIRALLWAMQEKHPGMIPPGWVEQYLQ